MPLITISVGPGLEAARMRFAEAQMAVPTIIQAELHVLAQNGVNLLHDAAPVGKHVGGADETPIEGDAPGPLADSFSWVPVDEYDVSIVCSQPHKLHFVVDGRGPVRPVRKRALYWPGLDHPVKYARATTPNDFITPVLLQIAQDTADVGAAVLKQIKDLLESG